MATASSQPDVLVLGGGLAGAAAAIVLARNGCPVTLLERETVPRNKVCGEFLSIEALDLLAHLGVDLAGHGAPGIGSVRLAAAQRVVEAPLPFAARSLTRRCLDGLLLQAAHGAGATVIRGRSVEQLTHADRNWTAQLDDGEELRANRVVLATGKYDLRGFPRPPGPQPDLVALKMYLRLSEGQTAELSGAVELLLHPEGYTGLQLVEDGIANLCALVRRTHLAGLRGWHGLLGELRGANAHAEQRLHGAVALLDRPLAVSSLPYGFVRRKALGPELYAVGDQAAVIPSFTGDGMSLALHTGVLAAQALLSGQTAEAFQRKVYGDVHLQVARATVLSRALLHPLGRPLLTTAAHVWPGGLRVIASWTRLRSVHGARRAEVSSRIV